VSGNDAKTNGDEVKIDATLKAGTGTDAETLQKEEEAINIDGLNVKQVKELRDKVSHKHNKNTENVSFRRIP
jgi:PDZ domain-containing secreted protein